MGDVSWMTVLGRGSLELRGPAHLRRALPTWLKLSPFANPLT